MVSVRNHRNQTGAITKAKGTFERGQFGFTAAFLGASFSRRCELDADTIGGHIDRRGRSEEMPASSAARPECPRHIAISSCKFCVDLE